MKKILFISMITAAVGFTSCGKDDNKNEEKIAVEFTSVIANGVSNTATTSVLTLNFDKNVAGLGAEDITVSGSTVTKGALKGKGSGVYELALANVTEEGQIGVKVAKEGYVFSPDSRNVTVFFGDNTPDIPEIEYIGSETAEEPDYFVILTNSNEGYATFYPEQCYTLGSLASPARSALVVNKLLKASLDRYEVNLVISGGTSQAVISVGYVTDPEDISSYVEIKVVDYEEASGDDGITTSDYVVSLSEAGNVPATAYLTIHYDAATKWQNNSFHEIIVTESR